MLSLYCIGSLHKETSTPNRHMRTAKYRNKGTCAEILPLHEASRVKQSLESWVCEAWRTFPYTSLLIFFCLCRFIFDPVQTLRCSWILVMIAKAALQAFSSCCWLHIHHIITMNELVFSAAVNWKHSNERYFPWYLLADVFSSTIYQRLFCFVFPVTQQKRVDFRTDDSVIIPCGVMEIFQYPS